MDFHNLNRMCSLCFSFVVESLNTMKVLEKIEKYLQIKMEYSWAAVCSKCCNSLEEFHEFYERVHEAQKNFPQKYTNHPKGQEEQLTDPIKIEIIEEFSENTTDNQCTLEDNTHWSSPDEKRAEILSERDQSCVRGEESNKETYVDNEKITKATKLKEISNEVEQKMVKFYNIKCEKCEDCKFTSFKMLSKHYMTVHNTQGYIKCCKRNIRVNDKYYLRSHMLKHLQPESCRCGVCGKELSSLATLKHHMILHRPAEERPFKCNKCDKRFCCKNDLKNHEKAIHIPENEREDYICDVCGKVFHKVANLRYHHSTIHLQERKFICEICAKCFTTQSGLRTHINAAHSNLDPIQCHKCHKWLKTRDTFQKHLQLHQNNSYPCTHCDKICNSPASLRSHLVKHSEERPHTCIVCNKSFKTKTHLKNHSTQHVAGNHHKCPYCSKVFVNMSNYYTHRKRMHSMEKFKKPHEIASKDAFQVIQQTSLTQQDFVYDFKSGKNDLGGSHNPILLENAAIVRENINAPPDDVKFV